MVLGLTAHNIKVNSSVPENNQHSYANIYLQAKQKIEYPMFQIQIINIYNVFLYLTFPFPQSRQHIIVSKLKLKLSSFVLCLELLEYKRFKNGLWKYLEYTIISYSNEKKFRVGRKKKVGSGLRNQTYFFFSPKDIL